MNIKLSKITTFAMSTLILIACQTPTQNPASVNQTQTINMPVVMVNVDSDGDGVADKLDQCPNTGLQYVVDERGCPLTMGPDMSLKIEYRAFFSKGSSDLLSKYEVELDKVGIKMHEHDTAIMRIEGSISENETDDGSSIAMSNTLAKNRALMVKNYLLLKHSIAPNRLTTLNCEARAPIAPNDTEEGRSFNRRVYAIVFKPEEQEANYYQNDLGSNRCIEF